VLQEPRQVAVVFFAPLFAALFDQKGPRNAPAARRLSASHKRALAEGRTMSATVDRYLSAVNTPKRRGRNLDGLIHHSDRGVQYLSIRYTERLGQAGVVNSVGSRGDSYDNALAESFNGLYKTELIRRRGPWRGLDDVEFATLEWIDWFNHRRLHGEIGMIPPAELETAYYRQETKEPQPL
jgi:putative transposase